MDIDDPLEPFPTGPRGVAGSMLERLEREALAEEAARQAAERGVQLPPASKKSKSTHNGNSGGDGHDSDGRPTYVPGQKRKQPTSPSQSNGAPHSSTSTVKGGGLPSTSAAASAAGAGSSREDSSSGHVNGVGGTHGKAGESGTRSSAEPSVPHTKKKRIQPTIRMQFTFPPYPPGKEPIAKHVPIFNVHQLATSKGLLLPPEEEMIDEGSSSGGSDDENDDEQSGDNEAGDASMSIAPALTKNKEEETDSQRQLREAIELAKRRKQPVLAKKRILERDEGYDAEDPFVDDSDLAMNEPKVQARPKVDGYVAIQGEVEVWDNNLGSDGKPRKGRKAGSINKPKVAITMPDGSTKFVSEAVAAREAKKTAKGRTGEYSSTSGIVAGSSAAVGGGAETSARASSASESPAPRPPISHKNSNGVYASPGKVGSSAEPSKASGSAPPATMQNNPNGPLMSRDAVPYSHLPSSFGFPSMEDDSSAAQTPPPPSNKDHPRPSAPPNSSFGTRTSPIPIDDDGDVDMSFGNNTNGRKTENASAPPSSSAAKPRQSNVFAFDPSPQKNKDGKRIYQHEPVSNTLDAQLDVLRAAVAKESFVPKNKFPPSVKPILMETALTAMRTGEYDDNFFDIMPNIFPYNRFTMHKMIKREVCEIRCNQLEEEIKVHVEEFKAELDKILPEAMRSYEDQLAKWREDVANWEREHGNNGATAAAAEASTAMEGQRSRNSLTPVGSEGDVPAAPNNASTGAPEKPLPKFKFSQNLRMCLFKIMTLNTEISERITDKATVEEKEIPSAMNAVKARYATLVQLWPEGWMTSNQLSRELTQAKKKVQSQMNR